MKLKINLVRAKSILIKTGLPGSDWVINPYNGCTFACRYCYAAQIARWKHPGEEWGSFVDVKVNAAELLKRELERLEKKTILSASPRGSQVCHPRGATHRNFGSVFFSSVTDPYIGLEAKYGLTRSCLQVLADFGYKGSVSVQTKSPLVIRDIDILQRLPKAAVGFTVTTLDDKVSRFLEGKAPLVSARLAALGELNKAGISTYAFVGPILPHFMNDKTKLSALLDKLENVGVKEVWFEHINLSPKIKGRLFEYLRKEAPELAEAFSRADSEEYREGLEKVIYSLMKGRKMKMGLGKVIHHRKVKKGS